MKLLRYLPIFLVLFGVTGVTGAIADNSQSVVVINNTSYTLTEFYASDVDSSSWDTSNNLLSGQSVGPGQQTTINISGDNGDCSYDLMAVLYGAAQHAYQYQVNTCDGGSWTINQ
jgi:hypothetical protein